MNLILFNDVFVIQGKFLELYTSVKYIVNVNMTVITYCNMKLLKMDGPI